MLTLSFKKIVCALCLAISVPSVAAERQCVLNYSRPAGEWIEALPMGNGRLGTMVYGGTAIETVALNEVTLWSGQEDPSANDLCGAERLREMREAFFRGDVSKGNELGEKYLSGHGKSFGTHLPFGSLRIERPGISAPQVTDYRRSLCMNDAVATVSFKCGAVTYTNEYFTSNPDQVSVLRLRADRKHSVSLRLGVDMLRHSTVTADNSGLDIEGDARFDKNGEGGVRFRGMVRVIPVGGKVSHDAASVTIENADEVMLVMDIRTDYRNSGYRQQVVSTVENAAKKGWKSLKKAHTADFSHIFNRMDIDLGGSLQASTNTDTLFADAHSGKPSPAFDALFFQYGRYMLISSSRENSPLPANLQGIWNDNLACNMPWTCDYHLDINIQQNYWSANIANMAETNMPLFAYIRLLADYGSETAKRMYGCRGWVAHTINNVWGDTAPGSGVGWAMNVTAGAWLATQLWAHYDYTHDVEWLRREGYPLMKRTAEFFVDYMVEDQANGYLLTGPSISPENSFMYAGRGYSLSMMPTIDRAVVHDIYNACIKSSEVLDIDTAFRKRLEHDIRLLPPYKIGADGTLNEWYLDVSRTDMSHRHASHLLGLYPFGEISPERNPTLAKACETFLDRQTHNGRWEDNEWSRGNMINFYARLKNPDEAYAALVGLYTGFMRENLMTVSPAGIAGAEHDIFSFDATEAAVAGVCEMLLQSYDGYLDFLPSLPSQWKDGSVKGICARGGMEADITWRDGKVVAASVTSKSSQSVTVKVNGKKRKVALKAGKKTRIV